MECAGQILLGGCPAFLTLIDLPPISPGITSFWSSQWGFKYRNILRIWRLGDSVTNEKNSLGNGIGSNEHRDSPGGLAGRVEILPGNGNMDMSRQVLLELWKHP